MLHGICPLVHRGTSHSQDDCKPATVGKIAEELSAHPDLTDIRRCLAYELAGQFSWTSCCYLYDSLCLELNSWPVVPFEQLSELARYLPLVAK